MKKVFRYFVNIVLVMTSFVIFYVPIECSAAKTKTNVVFTEVSNYVDEQQLKYDLSVSENSTIAGITIEINYDSRQLKLLKSEVGEVLQPTISKVNSQIENKVILTAISTDAITKEGTVLHLEFEIIDSSKQYLDITCSIDECINQSCDELLPFIESEKITNPLYKADETNDEISESSTEIKGETSNTDKTTQNKSEEGSETSDTEKPLQIEAEVNDESIEESDTSENSEQDAEYIDSAASNQEEENKSQNETIFITIIITLFCVTLLTLATWIRRKKK